MRPSGQSEAWRLCPEGSGTQGGFGVGDRHGQICKDLPVTEWGVDQRRWHRGWGLREVARVGHWGKEEGAEMLRRWKGWTAVEGRGGRDTSRMRCTALA